MGPENYLGDIPPNSISLRDEEEKAMVGKSALLLMWENLLLVTATTNQLPRRDQRHQNELT